MKVVLIAESEDTIKEYTAFLEEAGADVITYRWFLKALDNLTEIQPHIIIVSALDFPRHWKTLFTHIEAGELKTQPLVYLITDPSFTASEKKKAMFLGAQDIFYSPLTNRDKNSLLSMLPAGMGIETPSMKKQEPVPESNFEEPDSLDNTASPEVSDTSLPETSEYEQLKKQAESNSISENKIHNIAAAEANAFDLIDSEISNLENDDGPADELSEVTDDSSYSPGENLIVESADEDILTKLEEEMIESESESEPEPERPEQVTWSAPIDETEEACSSSPDETLAIPDENEDSIQFSFINPRSGLVVNGSVETYEHPTIKFIPSSSESVEGIRFGQILEQCKFSCGGETVKTRAQVRGLGKKIEFCLLY